MREGGEVRRVHTMPYHGQYTVGQHSFNAVNLILLYHPEPSLNLIKAVLWHDLAERHVGDMPTPAKWLNPQLGVEYEKAERAVFEHFNLPLPDLTREEQWWLRSCDKLELFLWAKEQVELGNVAAQDFIVVIAQWFHENRLSVPQILMKVVGTYEASRNKDMLITVDLEEL